MEECSSVVKYWNGNIRHISIGSCPCNFCSRSLCVWLCVVLFPDWIAVVKFGRVSSHIQDIPHSIQLSQYSVALICCGSVEESKVMVAPSLKLKCNESTSWLQNFGHVLVASLPDLSIRRLLPAALSRHELLQYLIGKYKLHKREIVRVTVSFGCKM